MREGGEKLAHSIGFEIGDHLPKLYPLVRMHDGKFQAEDIALDPSNLRLFNP